MKNFVWFPFLRAPPSSRSRNGIKLVSRHRLHCIIKVLPCYKTFQFGIPRAERPANVLSIPVIPEINVMLSQFLQIPLL